MSVFNSIKRIFGGSASEPVNPVTPPRPTPLSERKKKGLAIGAEKHRADIAAAKKDAQTNQQSNDPYSTAAWEVDAGSGRRRLKKVDPTGAFRQDNPNNPYDTSTELDPWKRK